MSTGDTLQRIRANWQSGVLDSAIDDVATGLTSSDFVDLPVVEAPYHLALVLDKAEDFGDPEIVWVESHVAASNAVVVVRGREDTVARSHGIGVQWVHGLTAFDMDDTSDLIEANTDAIVALPALYLELTGLNGPMTGLFDLAGAPTADLHAATKLYVDGSLGTHTADPSAHHVQTPAQTYLHADLTDVSASQHHTKYTDGNAVSAMGAKANSNDLNHDRYTDANARSAVDNGTYLKLSGGTLTGVLKLIPGTVSATSLRFGNMGTNDGLYGDTNEFNVSVGGFRTLSVFDDTGDNQVQIRGNGLVPLFITRQTTGAGDAAIMMRFQDGNDPDITINVGNLKALALL